MCSEMQSLSLSLIFMIPHFNATKGESNLMNWANRLIRKYLQDYSNKPWDSWGWLEANFDAFLIVLVDRNFPS